MADSKVYDLDAMIGLGEPIQLAGEIIGNFRSMDSITHRTFAEIGRLRIKHAQILERMGNLKEENDDSAMEKLDALVEEADDCISQQLALITDLSDKDRARIPTILAGKMVSHFLADDDAAPKQQAPTPLPNRKQRRA